jgi:hypothetical protein
VQLLIRKLDGTAIGSELEAKPILVNSNSQPRQAWHWWMSTSLRYGCSGRRRGGCRGRRDGGTGPRGFAHRSHPCSRPCHPAPGMKVTSKRATNLGPAQVVSEAVTHCRTTGCGRSSARKPADFISAAFFDRGLTLDRPALQSQKRTRQSRAAGDGVQYCPPG